MSGSWRIALGAVVVVAAAVLGWRAFGAGGGKPASGTSDYWIEELATGLDYPTSMTWLPDGRLLVLERMGGLRVVEEGKLLDAPIEGVPASFQSDQSDGLRDVAIDPDFTSNQLIYLLLSQGNYDGRSAAVYRGRLQDGRLEDVERIFITRDAIAVSANTSMPTRMMFLPDKTLLVAVAGIEKLDVSQRLDSHAGKILRINRDGSPAEGNPFAGRDGALPEIWSYGHRVVLGMCRFADQDRIWFVEPAARGGDELNLLRKGANYGWSEVSWSFSYENNGAASANQTGEGVEDPKLVWVPAVTPSGLACYDGDAFPEWKGDIFLGYLSGKAIERLTLDEQFRPVSRELIGTGLDERIRDVRMGPDGLIYILTDSSSGRLLRLRPGEPDASERARIAPRRTAPFIRSESKIELGDPARGKEVFVARCASCHSVRGEIPGGSVGPDLAGLLGRPVASQEGYGYSTALKGKASIGMQWNLTVLEMLLSDPTGFAPGTTMTVPLENREERRAVMAYLKQNSEQAER